jgi:hypothetical protein
LGGVIAGQNLTAETLGDIRCFTAMNRFHVTKGTEAAFEKIWL